MEIHPCPYLYDNGTHIFFDNDLELYCDDSHVTHEMVNLRQNDGARYDPIIDLAVEVIGYNQNHRSGIQSVLKKLQEDYDKKV